MDIARTPDNTVYPVASGSVNHLVGEMLTLVDASIADPTQRKAVKDLATQKIWSWWISQQPQHEYEITYFQYNPVTQKYDDRVMGYTTRDTKVE